MDLVFPSITNETTRRMLIQILPLLPTTEERSLAKLMWQKILGSGIVAHGDMLKNKRMRF